MFIYKINNFKNKFGQLDYKRINLKGNYGQLYPHLVFKDINYAIVCNDEYFQHEDLEIITVEEYEVIKQQIQKYTPKSEEDDRIEQLETALLEISTLSALQQAQNEQAIMELTMMIGGM